MTKKNYLIFDFISVAGNGDAELFPADANRLHCVARVTVFEYECLLYVLVDVLELVNVGLEADQRLLHEFELMQLLLEALHVHGGVGDLVVLPLDPRAAHVRLLRKHNAQVVVLLLLRGLLLQGLIPQWHQILHLLPIQFENILIKHITQIKLPNQK